MWILVSPTIYTEEKAMMNKIPIPIMKPSSLISVALEK